MPTVPLNYNFYISVMNALLEFKCKPVLFEPVTVWGRSHQGDVPVLVLVQGHAHDTLELGCVRMQHQRKCSVEIMLAIV